MVLFVVYYLHIHEKCKWISYSHNDGAYSLKFPKVDCLTTPFPNFRLPLKVIFCISCQAFNLLGSTRWIPVSSYIYRILHLAGIIFRKGSIWRNPYLDETSSADNLFGGCVFAKKHTEGQLISKIRSLTDFSLQRHCITTDIVIHELPNRPFRLFIRT